MQPKLRPFKRIKERYNAVPTAAEKAHREQVRKHPCAGCGAAGVEVHHLMQDCPGKRWKRRDHRFQVPLCASCHRGMFGVHGIGSEVVWSDATGTNLPALAMRLEAESVALGILPAIERRAA